MRILGIETSCDETAIAIVSGKGRHLCVEKNLVYSQIEEFKKYGGVIPEMAARLHLEAIMPLLDKIVPPDGRGIDAIAVTAGPGLAPALRTGVEVAKTLATLWNKPLIGVSHMEGHISAAWLKSKWYERSPRIALPALCLLVSGGHTELVLMEAEGKYKRVGETWDDAAGEAFDKAAKMLGLPYPGGPEIAKLAATGNPTAFDFPRGLLDRPNLDFSFSGIKTSVLYTLRENESQMNDPVFRANIAASFQEAVVDVLVRKTERALKKYPVKSVIVAGGVSANKLLRERLEKTIHEKNGIPVYLPPFAYSLDNAAMIAAAGFFHIKSGEKTNPLTLAADPNLDFCYE